MSKHAFTVVVAFVIGASLLLYMFAYTVRENQVAVLLTFNKPAEHLPQPGLHFKLPWPIQTVNRYDSRLQPNEGRFEETRTKDKHNVIASVFVGWKVDDKTVLSFDKQFAAAKDPVRSAAVALRPIVSQAANEIISQYNLGDFVSAADGTPPKYEQIEGAILASAQPAALQYGIQLVTIKVRRLELPETLMQAVHEQMKSERMKEATDISSGTVQLVAGIQAKAEAEKNEILALAQSQAESLRGEGDRKAAESYTVFAESPELSIYLREIRALRETLKERSTIILDTNMSPYRLLAEPAPEMKPAAKKPVSDN